MTTNNVGAIVAFNIMLWFVKSLLVEHFRVLQQQAIFYDMVLIVGHYDTHLMLKCVWWNWSFFVEDLFLY